MPLYDTIGRGYSALRRPDPRIAAAIDAALGDVASVVNVGAGTGSYEPRDRSVIAVEPSEVMIRQRPSGSAPCRQGMAEALPLESASVDAAMAILTVHHWPDLERGLREMARAARRRVVVLTWVPDAPGASPFWLTQEYLPQILAHDRTIFPAGDVLTSMLERAMERTGSVHIAPVPVPHDCADGFLCAYWRRPESYLDARVRAAISSFARIDAEPGLARLRTDLAEGRWARANRSLLALDELDLGYRLIRCELRDGAP